MIENDSNFIANMEKNSVNPDLELCTLHLIRKIQDIKSELSFNISSNDALNHLRFSKKENSTKILGLEVLNKDLDALYNFDDAVSEITKMNLRLPTFNEIRLMSKYRNFIGGFITNGVSGNRFYWTSTLFKDNHHCAMNFSLEKEYNDNLISYVFKKSFYPEFDKFSVRPVK